MSSVKAIGVMALALMVLLALYAQTRRGEAPRGRASVHAACDRGQLVRRLTELREASGLAVSHTDSNLLWAHNDSSPMLYGIGHDGAIKARVRLAGVTIDDWEAIASGPCPEGACLYIGDIGDNRAARRTIAIYRVREPAMTDQTTQPAVALQLSYPDGPHDAETLFVTRDGALFVVTKGEDAPVSIYRLPGAIESANSARLERVATLMTPSARTDRVTDGALSPDGRWVVLRTNDRLDFFASGPFLAGSPGAPRQYDLSYLREPQGEGIAWAPDNTLFLVGEGPGGGTFARVSCNLPAA